MKPENNRYKGTVFEKEAVSFLINKKYTILETNYRRKTGEIDIIAKDPDETIVFIEVKYRKNTHHGFPEEAVTKNKQKIIYRTAEWYIKERFLSQNQRFRFDVIAILGDKIVHKINAFGGF